MSFTRKTITTLVLAALAVGAFTHDAASNWGWGGWFFVPDLRVATVKPSGVSPNHVRVVLHNAGYKASSPCYVVARSLGSPTGSGVTQIPGMSPGMYMGIDVYVGAPIMSSPGNVTEVIVDFFDQVAESDETNNRGYYVAPAW